MQHGVNHGSAISIALGITTYFKKLYRTYLKKKKNRIEIENFFGFPQKRSNIMIC